MKARSSHRILKQFGLVILLFLSFSWSHAQADALVPSIKLDQVENLIEFGFTANQIRQIKQGLDQNNRLYNANKKLLSSLRLADLSENVYESDQSHIITSSYPTSDYLTYYIPTTDGNIRSTTMGDELAYNKREIQFRLPSARVNVDRTVPSFVLIATLDTVRLDYDVLVKTQQAFESQRTNNLFAYGLFFGSLLALAIYNLVLLLYTREPSYGWYSGYVLFTALLLAYMSGMGQSILWPALESNGGNTKIGFWTVGGIIFTMTGFVYTFLNLEDKFRFFRISSIAVLTSTFVLMVALIFSHHGDIHTAFFIVSAVQLVVILTVSVLVYWQYRSVSIYLLLGYLILFPVIFASLLKYWGVFRSTDLLNHSYELALLIEAFILSFGVGEKFRQLKGRELIAVKKLKNNKEQFLTNLMNVREQEKREFGLVLHNSVAQNLALIKTKLRKHYSDQKGYNHTELTQYIDDTIDSIRTMSHLTYPYILEQFGLTKATEQYAENNLDEREIDWVCDIDEKSINENQQLALYRLIQEAINNVYRHSQASIVRIRLQKSDFLHTLVIRDDGVGFSEHQEGFGLATIRQYASVLNGTLTINEEIDHGSELKLAFPIDTSYTNSSQ